MRPHNFLSLEAAQTALREIGGAALDQRVQPLRNGAYRVQIKTNGARGKWRAVSKGEFLRLRDDARAMRGESV